MLVKLTVKNVALIEAAEIEFSKGLNVLSGETGAGKSVILDSVNFVLGAKADKTMIRYGESECFVRAEFEADKDSKAVKELEALDIESDGEIIISRRFSDSGKNSIKINGTSVTAAMLRRVTDALVDVHGQSEHFFLLKESNQLRTLDEFSVQDLMPLKARLNTLLGEVKGVKDGLALLGGDVKERARRLELLGFQIEEIENADIQENEEEELLSKRNKINHLEKIIAAIKDASGALSNEGGAIDAIGNARRALSAVSRLDQTYEELTGRLETLALDAEDIAETLLSAGEELYFDENEAEEIETRLDEIRALKRKYGSNKSEIDKYLETIKKEYELLADSEGQYETLTKRKNKLNAEIFEVAKKMTVVRKSHGQKFCQNVENELKTLHINSARFEIEFKEYALEDAEKANSNGLDEIRFLFSANAGEPLKPLSKIISGGEMSRFMLAVKTQISGLNGISTYIFDEIDAGIGGKTAKVVGEKFARIAKDTQILAVSHLAQIAAMSDREFLIEKKEENGKTHTYVSELDEEQKCAEVVRLLGGDIGDEAAKMHAEELIRQAKAYKNGLF